MKLLELNSICIINCTTSKKRTESWTIDCLKKFKPQKLEFRRKEDSSVPIGWSLRFLRSLGAYVRCVGWKPRCTSSWCVDTEAIGWCADCAVSSRINRCEVSMQSHLAARSLTDTHTERERERERWMMLRAVDVPSCLRRLPLHFPYLLPCDAVYKFHLIMSS